MYGKCSFSVILAGDKLVNAGPPDVVPEDDPYAALKGKEDAQLWVVSAANGDKLAEYQLNSIS